MKINSLLFCLLMGGFVTPSFAYVANANTNAPASNNDPAYVRFPSARANTVVFTSEGDLWKVGQQGGQAQRLTTHLGMESNAAISPDGQWVAFSANYEGGTRGICHPYQWW